MRVTDNGYRVPQDGDSGNVWSDAIEFSLDRVALHKHDGIDSEKITIENLQRSTTLLDPSNWAVNGSGSGYVQNVSMPAGLTLDKVKMKFSIASGPNQYEEIHPTVKPTSITSFRCIINNPSYEIKILYV
ncbi:MAG: hypothetical protein N4A33_04830 [Bacteriovoracaceae bacterium]|jgi:hypothetical protein|nr:hypothetical protein [Bacteriovoracaceae bacterium]